VWKLRVHGRDVSYSGTRKQGEEVTKNERDHERELAIKFEDECMPNGTMGTGRGARIERIVAAAIFYNGVVYSVPAPGRHHDLIRIMKVQGLPDQLLDLRNQGFLTSMGRFVDRYEAAKIARAAGQIIREPTPPDMLTSEDVW
jgi:hypothetical protein